MPNGNHQHRLDESLSALMDGEVSELDLRRLVKASTSDSELAERWSRYQLAASVLRGERVAPVNPDLAAAVSAAIADEKTPQRMNATSAGILGRWQRTLSRSAIAATVAFVALLSFHQLSSPPADGQFLTSTVRPMSQPVQSAPQPQGFYIPAPHLRTVSTAAPQLVPDQRPGAMPQQSPSSPELMRHLNRVLVKHSEHAAHMGSQGMVPFVRASYSDQNMY